MLIMKKYIEICILIRAHLSLMNVFFPPFFALGRLQILISCSFVGVWFVCQR